MIASWIVPFHAYKNPNMGTHKDQLQTSIPIVLPDIFALSRTVVASFVGRPRAIRFTVLSATFTITIAITFAIELSASDWYLGRAPITAI
jgi:hypothetical protein